MEEQGKIRDTKIKCKQKAFLDPENLMCLDYYTPMFRFQMPAL